MRDEVILFLDFDGVVNTPDLILSMPDNLRDIFRHQEETDPLDPIAVGLINKLCLDNDDIRIVCSSVWRFLHTQNEIIGSLEKAHSRYQDMTEIHDVPYAIRFHDDTSESWRTYPDFDYDRPRGKAINKWLEDYGDENQKYLIIDDDGDFYPEQKHRLIQTNALIGFSSDKFLEIEDILENNNFDHPISRQLNLNF